MKMKINKNFLKIFKNKKSNNIETIHYLIAELKAYGIKNIIASPGMQNAGFNYIVQNDSFFSCYSVIDERSAAYVATGMSFETKQPTVITCTGATASRNYLSALTEAYYNNIPLVAITFFNPVGNEYNLTPQYVNRSVTQQDIKRVQVNLPDISKGGNISECLILINAALSAAKYKKVPVIINCPTGDFDNINTDMLLNEVWKTEYIYDDFTKLKELIKHKKTAIFIGYHSKFSKETLSVISDFANTQNIPVFCDHTSNYHGLNKILISQAVKTISKADRPELIIDLGRICGDYTAYSLFMRKNIHVCRVSELGDYNCRYGINVNQIYVGPEKTLFEKINSDGKITSGNYYDIIKNSIPIGVDYNNLPLCNSMVCNYLSKYIPKNSSLNISILNSLRCMNFINLDETIDVKCNVGGFGIDGALSTIVGMSLVNKDKKYFCLIGDLAFFYDMNILGNRHINKNIKIFLINNNRGEEFRLNADLENKIGEETDKLIAAANHNINGAKAWAESCGFEYFSTATKNNLEEFIKDLCTKEFNKPILVEIFIKNEDEIKGLAMVKRIYGQRM